MDAFGLYQNKAGLAKKFMIYTKICEKATNLTSLMLKRLFFSRGLGRKRLARLCLMAQAKSGAHFVVNIGIFINSRK